MNKPRLEPNDPRPTGQRIVLGVTTSAVAIGVALACAPAASASATTVTATTQANLNLRNCAAPGYPDCTVELTIPKGTRIPLTCYMGGSPVHGNGTWYATTYRGKSGWVSGYYLEAPGQSPMPGVEHCPD